MKKKYKILIFGISLGFAVLIWLYINLNLNFTVTMSLPLNIKLGEKQALSGEMPSKIGVTFKGKGWDLLGLWMSKNLSYNLDLTNIKRDIKLNSLQLINERVNIPGNVTVVNTDPDTIMISFDNLNEKYVKVKNNLDVRLKEGYEIIGSPKITPDSIKITGASSVISQINSVPTESIVIGNVNSQFKKEVSLIDVTNGKIKIIPPVVKIEYEIELFAEKEYDDIEIKVFNIPQDKEVILIPPRAKILVRSGVEKIAKFDLSNLKAGIDYTVIENDTTGYVIPNIEIPENFKMIKVEPEKFQYIIKKKLN